MVAPLRRVQQDRDASNELVGRLGGRSIVSTQLPPQQLPAVPGTKSYRRRIWTIALGGVTSLAFAVVAVALWVHTHSLEQRVAQAESALPTPTDVNAVRSYLKGDGQILVAMHQAAKETAHQGATWGAGDCRATAKRLEREVPPEQVFQKLEGVSDVVAQSALNQERVLLAVALSKCVDSSPTGDRKSAEGQLTQATRLVAVSLEKLGVSE